MLLKRIYQFLFCIFRVCHIYLRCLLFILCICNQIHEKEIFKDLDCRVLSKFYIWVLPGLQQIIAKYDSLLRRNISGGITSCYFRAVHIKHHPDFAGFEYMSYKLINLSISKLPWLLTCFLLSLIIGVHALTILISLYNQQFNKSQENLSDNTSHSLCTLLGRNSINILIFISTTKIIFSILLDISWLSKLAMQIFPDFSLLLH